MSRVRAREGAFRSAHTRLARCVSQEIAVVCGCLGVTVEADRWRYVQVRDSILGSGRTFYTWVGCRARWPARKCLAGQWFGQLD